MKKITFIGTLNSTFASKWREKLFPEQVQAGRGYAKKKSQVEKKSTSNRMRDAVLEKDKTLIESVKQDAEKGRRKLNINQRTYDKSPGFYKGRTIYDFEADKLAHSRGKKGIFTPRFKSSKQMAEELFPTNLFKSEEVINNKVTVPTNVPNSSAPKISPPSAKTPLLQAKKLPMGKIGIGAVGLTTLGAIGYGVTRKIRNDKGKKRGRYAK